MRRFLPFVLLAACSSTEPSGTVDILVDPDQQTLTKSPAPSVLQVDAIDTSGVDTKLATATLPATSVDLGSISEDTTGVVRVQALDKNGALLASGTSLVVQFGALDGYTLEVFVQRNGETAHLPNPMPDARTSPLALGIDARYLLVAGGDDPNLAAQTAIYDLGGYTTLTSPPKLPRVPKSLVSVGTLLLVIDDMGATWVDLADSTATKDATAPAGGAFGDVSGGATVVASDGSAYVVGGTRASGGATTRVLAVDTSGNLSWANLATERQGAAAAWAPGKGLVVAGGSTTGAGVELLAAGATTASALAFPSDATAGAGAAAIDATHVLLVGGVAPAIGDAGAPDGGDGGASNDGGGDAGDVGVAGSVRSIDLTCASSCTAVPWQATLPVPLVPAQVFPIDAANAIVVGDDPSGKTHLFRLATVLTTEIPLLDARQHARGVLLPTATVAVVGGAPSIETYLP